jgi:predicted branched-subunit amino acid permease
VLPVLPGVATFGLISGVAMIGSGMTPFTAMAMSVATYAGTAQLAALQLLAAGAPLVVIFFAALVLNLRFALYSLSMAPHFRSSTTPRKWLYSYLLSDNGYAHFITRYAGHPDESGKVGYYLGACTSIWTVWQASTAIGVALGAGVPTAWRLEFTVTLTFFALGISVIRDKAMAIAAATAAVTAVLAMGLPYRLGLIVAAAAGIAAGLLSERWTR